MDKDSDVVKTIAKVYVGGLNEDVEKYHLEEIFERYGLVKTVWIARNPLSRGYAFVTFFDPKHAEDAVQGLDGTTLLGSKLKVQLSKNEIVKMEREQKDPRDLENPRYRQRDNGRSEDRRRNRAWERDRSPINERRYEDDKGLRDVSPRVLDPGVIQESLMLREALLRSGFSPYSVLTNSLLQTSALPSLPVTCVKSPAFGTALNYLPYPHVMNDTLTNMRQQGDLTSQMTGQSFLLPITTPQNPPPSVQYSQTMANIHSPFLPSPTTSQAPRFQSRANTPMVSMTSSELSYSELPSPANGFPSTGHQTVHSSKDSEFSRK
jgi:RNA recognition motif-containing protein